jgi:addiction module RelB/DinJ family antitoxin
MSKSETITLRVEPKLLKSASRVLRRDRMSPSAAVTLFLRQVMRQGGLPFDPSATAAKARQAPRDAKSPARWERRPRAEDPLAASFKAWEEALQAAQERRALEKQGNPH